jgi:hypothetical protein
MGITGQANRGTTGFHPSRPFAAVVAARLLRPWQRIGGPSACHSRRHYLRDGYTCFHWFAARARCRIAPTVFLLSPTWRSECPMARTVGSVKTKTARADHRVADATSNLGEISAFRFNVARQQRRRRSIPTRSRPRSNERHRRRRSDSHPGLTLSSSTIRQWRSDSKHQPSTIEPGPCR